MFIGISSLLRNQKSICPFDVRVTHHLGVDSKIHIKRIYLIYTTLDLVKSDIGRVAI